MTKTTISDAKKIQLNITLDKSFRKRLEKI